MNKMIKISIGAIILFTGLNAGTSIVDAQAYLPTSPNSNYIPAYNGPVVSQTVPYNVDYGYQGNQITYYNPIITGYGNSAVVSNTYNNNNNNNYIPQNNTNIFALGNQYGPTVSSAGNTNNLNNYSNNTGISVDTYSATSTGIVGTTMNGGFVVTNPVASTTVWFEYGQSSGTLNQTTVSQSFSTTSGSFSKLVYGLKANTTYFYRAVAQNGQNVVKGDIVSFKTSKVTTPLGGSSPNSSGEGNSGEVLGDSEITQDDKEMNKSNLGALAFWSGFFPDTALGWIILIIIILVIILIARRYRKKDSHIGHH